MLLVPNAALHAITGAAGKHEVWVLKNGVPIPLSVTTGFSDGRMTEITGGPLQNGMFVITTRHPPAP